MERTPSATTLEEPSFSGSKPTANPVPNCLICKELMLEMQECLILTNCSHIFHRLCIENSLSQTAECPECHKACELVDLKKANLHHVSNLNQTSRTTNANLRVKGRGAMSKRYHTRNVTKNLFQENSLLDFSQVPSQLEDPVVLCTPGQVVSGNQNPLPASQQALNNRNRRQDNVNVDNSQLSQIIEASIVRILENLNIVANTDRYQNNRTQTPNVQRTTGFQPAPNIQNNVNRINPTHSHNAENFGIRTDKVTSIIQNWNLKFDGSSNGLSVDEFLYRIRSLTADNFNNDFTIICKNLHILLSGKARDWFWRYHKQVDTIQWQEFCAAIKYQYQDFKSNFDLREELRNRKMKVGESFDTFFEAVSAIIDRLENPIPEREIIEILTKNLRPDIRHELLYVPIYSIAHLRKLVQMRENLMNDEYFRRNAPTKPFNHSYQRRNVAEVDLNEPTELLEASGKKLSVDAVVQTALNSKCWNCDSQGHHWQDCLSERSIFCYGCGAKSTYKPQCQKCNSKNSAVPKNFLRPHPQLSHP